MSDDLVLDIGPAAHGGHCVARHESAVVFVRHTLPGERVRARLTQQRSRFWRADAVDVLQPSPDRVEHVWPEAGPGGVGGAELGHVSLPAQRRWKRDVVVDCLVRIGNVDAENPLLTSFFVQGLDDGDGLGSRTRVELAVDRSGRAGMFRHRSHEVLPLTRMPLAVPAIAALDLFGRTWSGRRVDAIAPADGEPVVLVDGQPWRSGRTHVRERVRVAGVDYSFRLAAAGFWQIHPLAPAVVAQAVLDAADLRQGDAVIDAYSGAGLLSLPLADAVGEAGRVVAIEGDAQAAKDARRNAHNHPQLDLHTGDVGQVLADLSASPDVVVLDPPRAGAGRAVMDLITAATGRRIVYVACDPAALARDVAIATAAGWELTQLRGFDLFPMTHHVECVALLTRTGSDLR